MVAVSVTSTKSNSNRSSLTVIFIVLFVCIVYWAVVSGSDSSLPQNAYVSEDGKGATAADAVGGNEAHLPSLSGLRASVSYKRQQIREALRDLNEKASTQHLPVRLQQARAKHEIVGERLQEVRAGKETVEEILHGEGRKASQQQDVIIDKPPMELGEIIDYLSNWIHTLHDALAEVKNGSYDEIWQAYHDLTVKTLYPWDRDYLSRMPPRRSDGSIFLSLATYRDENCLNTLTWAYEHAANPEQLFVGLVQQNCHENCQSGVLEGGKMESVPPDEDCYQAFCDSMIGKPICERKQVRKLDINEPESLGPYAARYFASKMWYGEQWYMQIDSHMTFARDWDKSSVEMLQQAPSEKPVLSHYPPSHLVDLEAQANEPSARLCGPIFATSDLESQIIRLEGSSKYDKVHLKTPRFAPFTAAGYFVAHSSFLKEVPFDPFLPWIFMGEEIIMSTRLWTAGYDIFSPTHAVLGHMYVRRHKPKFWESVHRAFTMGVHNPLQMLVLERIKYQLGYPEAARDMLEVRSIVTAVDQYSMGSKRQLQDYLDIVGLNMKTKEVTITHWCEEGMPPPGFKQFNHLYDNP